MTKVVYNLFFHPLSRFPGPRSHAISRIPYLYQAIMDELAFAHPNAWKEIQGHRKGQPEMEKAQWFYRPLPDDPLHIVNEGREEHGQLRRQMAHGFSEKAMRDQEPIIRRYVDLLVQQLRRFAQEDAPVVISDWYNYTTFDIIGDLAFGEPFGCLEGSNYDGWIRSIFASGRLGTVLQALSFYPLLKQICFAMAPQSMRDAHDTHRRLTREKMLRRMNNTEGRSDLIEGLLKKKDELGLSIQKLIANAEILIIGGSETTATLLSGVTYLLLKNPETYQNLTNEVRTIFQSEDEINLVSVNQLPYMQACLDEALRMYPPIANGLPRVCPKGGATVMGEFIPENTYLSVHHWALYRREDYFTESSSYQPERFLGHPKFENDQYEVLQPFHMGPRACLGRNFAYSEMRLIIALIIWHFDLRLADDCQDWIKQKNFLMWQKGPLKTYLTPAER
ncbi:cytochrome P450 [Aspergillus cavernicola]|uniref:Cytochrome P450 n=1 Tax=Aspergillus cavernicola TaxID=176166 RepID=A0ABR4ICP8_9EURO